MPIVLILGVILSFKSFKLIKNLKFEDNNGFSDYKNSFFISLSSKVGTGAIIGVLAAMYKISNKNHMGEGILLWVFLGSLILIPITYFEVFFTKLTNKSPRDFIAFSLNKKLGFIYTLSLVLLYCFGFVGFQFSGILTVSKIFVFDNFSLQISNLNLFFFLVIPILILIFSVIITKNHELFANVLASTISIVIFLYVIMFMMFLSKTSNYIPKYFNLVIKDFLNPKSFFIGLPIGFLVGFQRIIQTSETALGTSSLSSLESTNNPKKEALIQVFASICTLFIAVFITSYIFSYANNMYNLDISSNSMQRISVYIDSIYNILGLGGVIIMVLFFVSSGFTTILGSYHFLKNSFDIKEEQSIIFYMILLTLAGFLSISNFTIVFDIADLFMFVVSGINIASIYVFVCKYAYKFIIKGENQNGYARTHKTKGKTS